MQATDPRRKNIFEDSAASVKEYREEGDERCKWYTVSWVLFCISTGVVVAIWALDKYATDFKQTSNYYKKSFTVSPSISSQLYASSRDIYTNSVLNEPASIVMSLLFSWILWKLPLMAFMAQLVWVCPSLPKRIGSIIGTTLICLIVDSIMTVFLIDYWTHWMFFLMASCLIVAAALICANDLKKSLVDSAVPLLLLLSLYVIFSLLVPRLLKVFTDELSGFEAVFLMIYIFPIIDLILFSMVTYSSAYLTESAQPFQAILHFLLIGYQVGFTLLIGYTQVQFYFLLGYFIFRNIFTYWVLWKFDAESYVPPCLPGWLLLYYISYMLNFIPVIGVGNLVIARGFFSNLLVKTSTVLYGVANPLYPSTSFSDNEINTDFKGQIFWLAGLLIFVALTFSQKYPRRKPTVFDFFYNLMGSYLFYVGIACSLQIAQLSTVAF